MLYFEELPKDLLVIVERDSAQICKICADDEKRSVVVAIQELTENGFNRDTLLKVIPFGESQPRTARLGGFLEWDKMASFLAFKMAPQFKIDILKERLLSKIEMLTNTDNTQSNAA